MQNDSIDNLRLDLNRESVRGVIYVRIGDTRARTIHISLASNGTVVDLSNAIFCELIIKKPDDNECDQPMVRYGNELQYTFRTQDINVPGECKCQVVVTFEDGGIITSPEFSVVVSDTVIDPEHEKSTNEYTAISQILVDVTALKEAADDDAQRAENAEANVTIMEAQCEDYRDESKAIAEGLEGVLMPQGEIAFSDLDDVQMVSGFMWKITDEFTTDNRFAEGLGHLMAAGTSVYLKINGEFACLSGDNVVGIKGESDDDYQTGKITLKDVAFTGDYGDLGNTPTLGTAAAKDYTSSVTDDSTDLVTSGAVKSAIDTALSSLYKPCGEKTSAELIADLLVEANLGNVYNITTSGTTTSDFVEGAGKPIHVGDNVAIVDASGTYMFDIMAGFVDLSSYYTETEVDNLIANHQDNLTANKAYSIGDYFIYGGKLYKVTSAISNGGAITIGTNCTLVSSVVDQIPTNTNQLTNGAGFITSAGSCNYATSAGSAGSASTAGNITGTVAIANGGTGATSRLAAIANMFNANVANPNYVIGLTDGWASCGYTSISQLQSALSIPASLSNHLDIKTNVASVSYACNAGYGNYLILAFIQNVGCVMLTIMVQSGNITYKSLCARPDTEVASLVVATYTVNTININFTYSASFVSLKLTIY